MTKNDVTSRFRDAVSLSESATQTREEEADFNFFRLLVLTLDQLDNPATAPEQKSAFLENLIKTLFPELEQDTAAETQNNEQPGFIEQLIEELRGIVASEPSPERTGRRNALVERVAETIPDGSPMSLLRANLLDLIARPESGGTYNFISSFARRWLPEKQLTEMTVGEVLDWQQQVRRNGGQSTAAGRYQVIYKTLNGLVEQGVVSRDDVFDETTQDRIGLALAEGRGLNRFLRGEISATQFAENLSYEWAGIKCADGRGQYDGDGLNKGGLSHTTLRSSIIDLGNAFQRNGYEITHNRTVSQLIAATPRND